MVYTTEPINRAYKFYFNGYDIDNLSGNDEYEYLLFIQSSLEDSGIEYSSDKKLLTIKYNSGNPIFNVERLYNSEIKFTPFAVRRYTPTITVGGDAGYKFIKNIYEPISLTILWVNDMKSQIIKVGELKYSVIIYSKSDSYIDDLKVMFDQFKLMTMVTDNEVSPCSLIEVTLGDCDRKFKGNSTVFNTDFIYKNYRIEQEDYIHALITEMKKVLGDLDIVHALPQQDLSKPNVLYYKLVTTTRKSPPFMSTDFSDDTSYYASKIEFQLSLLDHRAYRDYLIKLDSVLRISNYAKYVTKDIYGDEWVYSVWWEHQRDVDEHYDFSKDEHENITYTIDFSGIISYGVKMRKELRDLCKVIQLSINGESCIITSRQ